MKSFVCILLLLFVISSASTQDWQPVNFSNSGKPHHHPTPTPTPTPKPTPTPTPTPKTNITLAWNASPATTNPGTNPVGYHLHIGLAAGAETQTIDEGNVTTATYTGTAGTLYFFTVTAYDAAGVDSPPSDEVSATAP
jgi:hypothetical protein